MATWRFLILVSVSLANSTAEEGEVRLAGGSSSCSGRVELNHHGVWGTVCDRGWGLSDAQVVCRQLGCGRAVSAFHRAVFGEGSGPVWLDEVSCSGSESSLTNCSHPGFGMNNCNHYRDAGVVCELGLMNTTAEVRLAGGSSSCSGRVELYHQDQWGTVCHDGWGLSNAQVVCRQLGCGRAVSALHSAVFGRGSGPIWLDQVSCSGSESSLTNCSHPGFGINNCHRKSGGAGVICELSLVNSTTEEGEVRLAGGSSSCSGRVELQLHGVWGTVCDRGWGLSDAQVVCRQLGCGRAVFALHRAVFGWGSGPIWLDQVSCSGSESSLTNCSHPGFGINNCWHGYDAGVVCELGLMNTTAEVRLAGGSSSCSGRVELYHQDQWGTVCHHGWDLSDAQVVCRQLGCGRAVSALHSAVFGRGSGPIWLNNVRCSGSESSLTNCSHPGFGINNCGHYQDAGVVCEPSLVNSITEEGEVRLAGGSSSCSGRVELYHQGAWGTVCDDGWDLSDAQVVCRQLGCGRALFALHRALFGWGSGIIWLDQVSCSGSESSLTNCSHPGFGINNCWHGSDAGVVCELGLINTTAEVRLAGGSSSCSGRVELYHQDQWGTVCDDGWDLSDAQVVCRQLGCGRALSALHYAVFGHCCGIIWLGQVSCSGSESSLTNCSHPGFGRHNCHRNRGGAGVICELSLVNSTAEEGEVRLAGGSSSCSGRVELYHQGLWGTVCQRGWGLSDAQVVCRQMDCGRALYAFKLTPVFGEGSGPVWLDQVSCSGSESSLTNCSHPGFGINNCGHYEDAGVICELSLVNSTAEEGEVRLAGGSSSCSGRVELHHYGVWGTICHYDWDLSDAQVVCRQLGCGRALYALRRSAFGRGSGIIWLNNVRCSGSESSLTNCSYWGSSYCGHAQDAGVVCELGFVNTTAEVRLAGGSSSCSGRVELYHQDQWGTVCHHGWDLSDAQVVCRQLGCGRALSALHSAVFGWGSGPVWLNQVSCSGSESYLTNCNHPGFGINRCYHFEDAGVICEPQTTTPSYSTTYPTSTEMTTIPATTPMQPTTTTMATMTSPPTTSPQPTTTMETITSPPTTSPQPDTSFLPTDGRSTTQDGPRYVVGLTMRLTSETQLTDSDINEVVLEQLRQELIRRGLPSDITMRLRAVRRV